MSPFSLNRLHKILILAPLCLLLTWAPVSYGRAFRLARLPDRGVNFGCATCHVNPNGGGQRNAFGEDYEAIALPAGDVYTPALGQTDSDGDGFSNDGEFDANPPTEPWNPDSHPPVEPRAVEPNGKTFTVWAQLKLLRPSRNFRLTLEATVPELTKTLERSTHSVRQANSPVIGNKRSVAEAQLPGLDKPSAKKIEEIHKPLENLARRVSSEPFIMKTLTENRSRPHSSKGKKAVRLPFVAILSSLSLLTLYLFPQQQICYNVPIAIP